MNPKKKILILTADAGFGHRSAANALAAAFQEAGEGSCECSIVNPADDPRTPDIIRRPQLEYDWAVRSVPHAYQLSYELSDTERASRALESAIAQLMAGMFQDLLRAYAPDAILSTYLLYNIALRTALIRNQMNIPFFLVVTDLADVHHLWFQPGPDMFFVPTEITRQTAMRNHIRPERIVVTGLPVSSKIAREKRDRTSLRRMLGWDPDLPVVMAVGSQRVLSLYDYLRAVDGSRTALQLAVVAGGNRALYDRSCSSTWKSPVHCYDYARNMPEMLHAADLVMTKAGGLITSEALACSLPLVFIEAIPGQETGNASYVCERSAGVMVKTPLEAQATIDRWLAGDRSVLEQFSRNAGELGTPEAAHRIAEEVLRAIQEKRQRYPFSSSAEARQVPAVVQ